MDREKVEYAVKLLLEALGFDINNQHLKDTPKRVADMWEEFLNSNKYEEEPPLWVSRSNLVIVSKINFYSFCPHHLLPYFGITHVAYLPSNEVVGLSKIVRVVRSVVSTLIIQEDATDQIADKICELCKTEDVMVVMKAKHLCMMMRGVKTDAYVVTSSVRGKFMNDLALRSEALRLMEV
ncbi:MAG: GTP cyclohydrolase I [Thermoplasmata archaeon]